MSSLALQESGFDLTALKVFKNHSPSNYSVGCAHPVEGETCSPKK